MVLSIYAVHLYAFFVMYYAMHILFIVLFSHMCHRRNACAEPAGARGDSPEGGPWGWGRLNSERGPGGRPNPEGGPGPSGRPSAEGGPGLEGGGQPQGEAPSRGGAPEAGEEGELRPPRER